MIDTDKAWHAISYLLNRASFPVEIVFGETQFSEELGYGRPGYLTPDEVVRASAALVATIFDRLIEGVSIGDLAEADIYPNIWDDPTELDWVRGWYEPLTIFFQRAANQGDGVLVWLQ